MLFTLQKTTHFVIFRNFQKEGDDMSANYPPTKVKQIDKAVQQSSMSAVSCLQDLSAMGRPKDIEALKNRIDSYFQLCTERNIYCGVEGLALSLSVSRMTFWNWCNGIKCTPEWQAVCSAARQSVNAFLEQAIAQGGVNPVIGIWWQKNWAGYSDQITIQSQEPLKTESLPAAALPNIGATDADSNTTLQIPDTED